MNLRKAIFRAWFYFRQGYNLYLAFIVGFTSNIVVLYRLGVQDIHFLAVLFPSLTIFAVAGIAVVVPLGIVTGLYHMKRTGAFAADASIGTEANPYIYKVVPGKEREVFLPLWILTAQVLTKVLERQGTMSGEDKRQIQDVLDKANALLEGEYIGVPRDLGVQRFPAVTESDK